MIKLLEWDSKHFGFNIANLEAPFSFMEMKIFCQEHNIRLTQCLVDITNQASIKQLENNGFYFADLKITLENRAVLPKKKENLRLSTATNSDLQQLKSIAEGAFKASRFYNPPYKRKDADRLFNIWLGKSVNGNFDDGCIVYRENDMPVGFLTYKETVQSIRIGLVAVSDNYRNKKIGSCLIQNISSFTNHKTETIEVATQGKNISAINFYIRNGFTIKDIQSWYYKENR